MKGRIVLLCIFGLLALSVESIERRVAAVRLLASMKNEDTSTPPEAGASISDLRLSNGEAIFARVYGPSASEARLSIVLGHGIHHRGINESRLIRFATHLSELGCRVLTPELPDLAKYEVTERGVEILQRSVEYLSRDAGKVGLIGFSFSGGLSLVAAEDPRIAEKLRYVASIGGYHDLARTLRFLATNQVEGPLGKSSRKAHEYGLLVLLRGHLEGFGLGEDRRALESALIAWLKEDRPLAREFAGTLKGNEARRIFELLEAQELARLAPEILPVIASRADELTRLSPAGRLKNINTTILFLHGAGDNVVPPEETLFAKRELDRMGARGSAAIVTPLLRHVKVDHPGGLSEQWRLVDLVARLL
jgi:pimeloyl-ACP methyl ester carboxylesterase